MPGSTTGVLLVNLGTPDAPRAPEVRRYLREFLGDPRVIDLPAPLRLALLDAYGSSGVDFEGEVLLEVVPDGLEIPPGVTFGAGDGGVKRVDLRVHEAGVYRILAHVATAGGDLYGQSNPLLAETNVAPIRWADLHGHSNLSDGTGTPDEFLTYARDVAGLDAVALTDHDHWGMLFLDQRDDLWREIRELTRRYHEPGRFVTFLGYE